jgi:hypothetical protein
MTQCDAALVNVGRPSEIGRAGGHEFLVVDSGRIVPVQVMQRSGYPIGKHYVVTQLDYFLRLARIRSTLEDGARAER